MSSFDTYENSYAVVPEPLEEKKYTFDISNRNSFQELLQNYNIVVVDVWASFCSPCLQIAPLYEKLAESFRNDIEKNDIIFVKDCIDDEFNESIHYENIKAVPTFFIYVYGKVVARIIGGDFEKLDHVLKELMDFSNYETPMNKKAILNNKINSLYERELLENIPDLFSTMNNSTEAVC
jgi:thioredoxin 1